MSTNSLSLLLSILKNWDSQQSRAFVGEPVPLGRPLSMDHYKNWIENHREAGMEYLRSSLPLKESPEVTFPGMKSIIPVAHNYFLDHDNRNESLPSPSVNSEDSHRSSHLEHKTTGQPAKSNLSPEGFPLNSLRTAHYSKGNDYHLWFREKLRTLEAEIQKQFPDEQFLSFTDSVPILERDFARQAGLGWRGKNTCLIHPKRGSFFFIGEILTSPKLLGIGGWTAIVVFLTGILKPKGSLLKSYDLHWVIGFLVVISAKLFARGISNGMEKKKASKPIQKT